eukprot:scaffold143876_cov32-Tisochrysis_lutea.AAC.2
MGGYAGGAYDNSQYASARLSGHPCSVSSACKMVLTKSCRASSAYTHRAMHRNRHEPSPWTRRTIKPYRASNSLS